MSAKNQPPHFAEPQPVTEEQAAALSETLPTPQGVRDAPRYIIGWREWLSLPDLGIPGVKAKIDTGARTSALHTHDYEIFERDGVAMVRFHLHPLRSTEKIELDCEAPVLDQREVKDSGGHPETRPFIETTARLGDFEWPVQLSLTNRESMKFRMLLGRQALAGYFLVDSNTSYLMGGNLSRVYK